MPDAIWTVSIWTVAVGEPLLLAWGWLKLLRRQRSRTFSAVASRTAFQLATASMLFTAGIAVWSRARGGAGFAQMFSAHLILVQSEGTILALTALLAALFGVWRQNPLSWLALATAFGTILFQVAAAPLYR